MEVVIEKLDETTVRRYAVARKTKKGYEWHSGGNYFYRSDEPKLYTRIGLAKSVRTKLTTGFHGVKGQIVIVMFECTSKIEDDVASPESNGES